MTAEIVPLSEQFIIINGKRRPALEVMAERKVEETRSPRANTWVKVNYRQGIKFALDLKLPALALWLVLNKIIFERHENPVVLSNVILAPYGISIEAKRRALRALAKAGRIVIEQKKGRSPLVTVKRPWASI